MTHLLINWPSFTAEFYSHKTKQSKLTSKSTFPIRLLESRTIPITPHKKQKEISKNETKTPQGGISDSKVGNAATKGSFVGSGLAQVWRSSNGNDQSTQFGAMWSGPPPFNVSWGTVLCQSHTGPVQNGRGTYVYRLSPSGDLSALAVNKRKAKDTRILFFSPLTQGGLTSTVYSAKEERQSGRYIQ